MPKRIHNQNTYVHGQWNALCDVCGFKFKSKDLKKRWDGMYVCKDDWEPRHPSDFFKAPTEDPSVPWTRPDTGTDSTETPAPAYTILADTSTGDSLIDTGSGDLLIES